MKGAQPSLILHVRKLTFSKIFLGKKTPLGVLNYCLNVKTCSNNFVVLLLNLNIQTCIYLGVILHDENITTMKKSCLRGFIFGRPCGSDLQFASYVFYCLGTLHTTHCIMCTLMSVDHQL